MDSDSDFYGDEDEIANLQSRLSSFHPSTYWSNRQKLTMECPPLFPPAPSDPSPPSPSSNQLHNPYEGHVHCAKQLSESPQAFLSRMPPSTTDFSLRVPWIYVANPFIPRRPAGTSEQGEEQEAPAEAGTQLGGFVQGGQERLELLGDFLRTVEAKTTGGNNSSRGGGVSKAAVTREVNKERDGAVNDILMLARMLKVRTGKWMLFIPPTDVDAVWSTIVHATLKNELGIAAKVAPRPEKGSTKERLICVYTYDFGDREDVARVLVRLKELDLVRNGPGARWIYYKTDAYTYLGIGSGNPWGIRASIYSSKDIFAEISKKEGKSQPPPHAPTGPRRKTQQEEGGGDDGAMDWTF